MQGSVNSALWGRVSPHILFRIKWDCGVFIHLITRVCRLASKPLGANQCQVNKITFELKNTSPNGEVFTKNLSLTNR
jgi:hypothetical protein